MGYACGIKWTYKVIQEFIENLGYELLSSDCKNNNIKLLRIPYWDFDKIEEILTNEILYARVVNEFDCFI